MSLRVIVVTSCTGEKRFSPANQLVQDDFRDEKKLKAREKELEEYALPAAEMYTGMQHLRLMEGLKLLRGAVSSRAVEGSRGAVAGCRAEGSRGKSRAVEAVFDLAIVSAGYGLIREDRKIVPYEVTFNTMKNPEIDQWAAERHIHEDLEKLLPGYDLVFWLLGDKYLRACGVSGFSAAGASVGSVVSSSAVAGSRGAVESSRVEGNRGKSRAVGSRAVGGWPKMFFFAAGTSRKFLPKDAGVIELSNADAKSFGYGLVGLKGFLFKLLAQDVVNNPQLLAQIVESPSSAVEKALSAHRKAKPREIQPLLFELPPPDPKPVKVKKGLDIIIPPTEFAANYTPHMKYFIPEWDDRVDPDYDFIKDEATPDRDPYSHDVYAHEMYPTPNYDGVLMSKIIVEQNQLKKARIEKVGCHDFIRFDRKRPMMGDCGAFGYVDAENPPYETEEILDYYDRLGFNIGVAIDHLIVGKYATDEKERLRRYKLTLKNDAEFIAKHKAKGCKFTPSGVAQGWDPKSYRDAFAQLVEMGYRHISLGGMVRSSTKDIVAILKEIRPLVPDYLQLHLFGVARADALQVFRQLGVSAMDSASHLRRAWLGAKDNYFSLAGAPYAAIRVPPVNEHGKRVKQMVADGKGTPEQFKKMENAALSALRKYDAGLISLDACLKPVLEYDALVGEDRDGHEELYRRTLADKPWQKCGCAICKACGIETVIFRGNNRNRRRGFHNTYVFYKQLKALYPDK